MLSPWTTTSQHLPDTYSIGIDPVSWGLSPYSSGTPARTQPHRGTSTISFTSSAVQPCWRRRSTNSSFFMMFFLFVLLFMTWYPIESKLELFLRAKVRSFFDMTKSCALYFLCLCIRQYLPPPKKKKKTRATSEGIPSSMDIELLGLNDNPYFTQDFFLTCSSRPLPLPHNPHSGERPYGRACTQGLLY